MIKLIQNFMEYFSFHLRREGFSSSVINVEGVSPQSRPGETLHNLHYAAEIIPKSSNFFPEHADQAICFGGTIESLTAPKLPPSDLTVPTSET